MHFGSAGLHVSAQPGSFLSEQDFFSSGVWVGLLELSMSFPWC